MKRFAIGVVLLSIGMLVLKAGGTPLTRPVLVDAAGNLVLLLALVLVTLGLAGAWMRGRE